MRQTLVSIALLLAATGAGAQTEDSEVRLRAQIDNFFVRHVARSGSAQPASPRAESVGIDDLSRTVTVTASSTFAMQELTPKQVETIYRKMRHSFPRPFNKYRLKIMCCGLPLEQLVDPVRFEVSGIRNGQWGDIVYGGKPWVTDVSRPNAITHGLYNRHIALWASHGAYFDNRKSVWSWQRPTLFATNEDLFTQTIVVPYLMPMLQNAGAVVFTPRERDWQRNEVIVDNDAHDNCYVETGNDWRVAPLKGFAVQEGNYREGENPFTAGTARMTLTTRKKGDVATASYQPDIREEGSYAVYVSYQTVEGSIDDAEYTVFHKGEATTFRVNQQMGGSTWVYLGTFDFDRGCNQYNRVVLTNRSARKGGIVTADAVRFGGGMGNMERGGKTSGLPRCLEGARYNAQWSGVPYELYSTKNGSDDYGDDMNVRSTMTNWLAGGSPYVPAKEGKGVPIELSLALHSDAGYDAFGNGIVGSLAVCTTAHNDGILNSGATRMISRDFAKSLLDNVCKDIKAKYKTWNRRYLWDRNYSETRCPEVPSAILEMLSHQNFPDMVMGQDPDFKFTMARSVYKTILRFVCSQHGLPCVVEPLPPSNFCIRDSGDGSLSLSWVPQTDPSEPSAAPTAYKVYVAEGSGGFDNGTMTLATHYDFKPERGKKYCFRVAAVNRGGESFRSETLAACMQSKDAKKILVVNGFNRLSSPAVIDDGERQGFDLAGDIGVQRGVYAGWAGKQICFDKSRIGREGPGGLGYGEDEMAGKFICGNTFDYVSAHADAISGSRYNVVSCSAKAVEAGTVRLEDFDCVDLVLGLEKNDGHSLVHYKTFSPSMQRLIEDYAKKGGRILVSGANIGNDMTGDKERSWLADVLKVSFGGVNKQDDTDFLNGLSLQFDLYRTPNDKHYAAQQTDVLSPVPSSYCAMQYADGTSAAVAYDGKDYRSFVAGFPLECVKQPSLFRQIMNGVLTFLLAEDPR